MNQKNSIKAGGPRSLRNVLLTIRLPFSTFHARKGVALVIILAFVVLLSGVVLAFFSRAISERQVSNSSANQTRVEILARGAADQIIADLKQEVADGSMAITAGTDTIYMPSVPANAVPQLAGSNGTGGLQNLLKRSANGVVFSSGPNASNRAAAVNSATNASLNNRSITPARWNKPLLLPAAGGAAGTDTTPLISGTFTAPDWVLVGRDGSNPKIWNTNLISTPSNSGAVVGRYAYNLYDEGGLLDVNAVGYPFSTTSTPSAPYTNSNSDQPNAVYKGALAFADLTQLPGIGSSMTGNGSNDFLTVGSQAKLINNLVGWRNYASAGVTGGGIALLGSSGGYTFGPLNIYSKSVLSNTNGFLATSNTTLGPNNGTDRRFGSRQELIRFLLQGVASTPNETTYIQAALKYLTHFSRALEQPSFVPNPNRPRIIEPTQPAPSAPDNSLTYKGNNDAAGSDDQINPSFLTVRTTATFNRNDGTPANIGEPLVKQRFSLKRLAWITYNGPSAGRGSGSSSTSDPDYDMWSLVNTYGFSTSFLQQGTTANIQKYFGLTWDNTNRAWAYNHGNPGGRVIGRLADLVSIREPDFAELLKASINVGSLGKAAEVDTTQQYQYNLDRSTDYQVLQIMANIIDQSDLDSYPTKIQFSAGGTTRTVSGAEDLPYAYRERLIVMCTKKPVPLLSNNDTVTFTNVPSSTGDGSTADVTVKHVVPLATASGATTLSDPGEATALRIPDVWNPYDPNCATTTSKAIRPTKFRVTLLTCNAGDPALNWQVYSNPSFGNVTFANATSGSYKSPNIPSGPGPTDQSPSTVLSDSNSALEFQDNAGALFREPTLLWRPNFPTGSSLGMGAGNALGSAATDVTNPNNKTYIGFLIGRSPISIIGTAAYNTTDPAKKSTNNRYIFQGVALNEKDIAIPGVSGANPGHYTFRVQYEYPVGSGKWFTYDEKFVGIQGNGSLIFCANTADFTNNTHLNPYALRAWGSPGCAYDPRASRFGMGTESEWNVNVPNNGPAFEVQLLNVSAANNATIGASDFTVLMTNRAGIDRGQSVPFQVPGWQTKANQMRWFSGSGYYGTGATVSPASPKFYDGLLAQNNPTITVTAKDGSTEANLYYEDPDGICRRAMGAYVPVGAVNIPATAAAGIPTVTANTIGAGGVPTTTAQSQSRPFILNRPFKSVAELSYTFRGTPWKNIDFFTPESGDAALLDTFCINDPPPDGIVAGKVSLNTRNVPVLQALLSGAYSDELTQLALPPPYALASIAPGDALNAANKLVNITTDRSAAWRGPLTNISDLVGRYIPNPGTTSGATDQYTFRETVTGTSYTYGGFSAALDSTVSANPSAPMIQRLREAPIRALAACGQTRVWNLMVDVIAQTGRYPQGVNSLDKFIVEGEKRYWVHVAIDRLTGKIIDMQIEAVSE